MERPPVPYSEESKLEYSPDHDAREITHVAAGEVTTLEHEIGDNAVEGRTLVTLALGSLAEPSKVLGGLGDNVAVEVEVDLASGSLWRAVNINAQRIGSD